MITKEITLDDLLVTHKRCPKCDCYKPREDFHVHKKTKDGLRCYCRLCHFRTNQQQIVKSSKDIEWLEDKRNKRKIDWSIRKGLDSTKYGQTKAQEKYKEKNAHKIKAREILNTAVKSGRVIKLPCSVCGKKKAKVITKIILNH